MAGLARCVCLESKVEMAQVWNIRLIDNSIALSSAESYSQESVKLKILGIFNQNCLKCIPVVCIPI